jgi:TPR repeat protein
VIQFSPDLPNVAEAQKLKEYSLGKYQATLYRDAVGIDAKSIPTDMVYRYPYVLWVTDPELKNALAAITSEQTPKSLMMPGQPDEPFLCAFTDSGHQNYGHSRDWLNADMFSSRALEIAAQLTGVHEPPVLARTYSDTVASGKSSKPKGSADWKSASLLLGGLGVAIAAGLLLTRPKQDIPAGFTLDTSREQVATKKEDPEKAFLKNLEKSSQNQLDSAQSGDPKSQFKVGLYYLEGWGTEKNLSEAISWLQKSAAQNFLPAVVLLGKVHSENGEIESAKIWLKKAADFGDPEAAYELGSLLKKRKSAKDNKEGDRLILMAAIKGWPKAQGMVGAYYLDGYWTFKKDLSEGIRWLTKGAVNGDHFSQARLCSSFVGGEGVNRDYAKAAEWCDKAAAQGNYSAMQQLSLLYEHGYGVKKDIVQAYALANMVSDSPDPISQQITRSTLDRLERTMTPDQINTAQNLARDPYRPDLLMSEIGKRSTALRDARKGQPEFLTGVDLFPGASK